MLCSTSGQNPIRKSLACLLFAFLACFQLSQWLDRSRILPGVEIQQLRPQICHSCSRWQCHLLINDVFAMFSSCLHFALLQVKRWTLRKTAHDFTSPPSPTTPPTLQSIRHTHCTITNQITGTVNQMPGSGLSSALHHKTTWYGIRFDDDNRMNKRPKTEGYAHPFATGLRLAAVRIICMHHAATATHNPAGGSAAGRIKI